jgi:hypothetical protein
MFPAQPTSPFSLPSLPQSSNSRLTARRLRRPTRLPTLTTRWGTSYFDRLLWLFTGRSL